MYYIESPGYLDPTLNAHHKSVFLAGGIMGCPDWQRVMVEWLAKTDLVLVNPRRADFPIHDPSAARERITWEHRHLRGVDGILFWFPRETVCPIALYELGAWSVMSKPIFVGMHPDYSRRQDVEIQTALARPGIEIVYSLNTLAAQVIEWTETVADE